MKIYDFTITFILEFFMKNKNLILTEQLLNLTEEILFDENDFMIPIKKLWLKLSLLGNAATVSYEEFSFILQQDDRFEVFTDKDDIPTNQFCESNKNDWEELGYYFGPRVMLKSRKPSRQKIGEILIHKTEQIFDNLKKAWDIRPQDDEDEEDQLLQALASTQKLLRTLENEFPESRNIE